MKQGLSPEAIDLLERSRRELLDLGLRNPLLNHRRRAKQVPVVDELSAEVFRILVTEGRSMTFLPAPEEVLEELTPGSAGSRDPDVSIWEALLSQPEEARPDGTPAARHVDTRLQTSLGTGKLQARLLSIHRDARTHIEEQGVNVLFLALGFLHWYESETAREPRRAPLVLVPVQLERDSVQGHFRLRYTGEDIGPNLSLSEKLKSEFAFELPPFPESDALEMGDYCDRVDTAIQGQSRWEVHTDEITLGFFSFGKFLMYKDLEHSAWLNGTTGDVLAGSPIGFAIVDALLTEGFRSPGPPLSDDTHIDRIVKPGDTYQVVDADSSQVMAILDAMAGRNLVLQGPPGTGKSQTITNLIAEALGRGRKVLFVSEKMAALDVVKRRLDHIGLGDTVLELHSHKTRKTRVLDELRRTLENGKPVADGTSRRDIQDLSRLQQELNDYCAAVGEPIGETSTNFIAALGRALKTKPPEGLVPLDFAHMGHWTEKDYRTARDLVESLDRHLEVAGPPAGNPFRDSQLTEFLPTRKPALGRALENAARAAEELLSATRSLADAMGLAHPRTIAEMRSLESAARRATGAPRLAGLTLRRPEWLSRRGDLESLFRTGRALNRIHRRHADRLIDEAWEADLLEVRQHYASKGDRWWRFLSSDFRRARARLRGLCRTSAPPSTPTALELIDVVLESQRLRRRFRELADLATTLLGDRWRGEESEWDELTQISEWMASLHRDLAEGTLPEGFLEYLDGGPDHAGLNDLASEVTGALRMHRESIDRVMDLLKIPEEVSKQYRGGQLETQRIRFVRWKEDVESDRLDHWIRFKDLASEMETQGLGFVLEIAHDWSRPTGELVRLFDHSWFNGLVEKAWTARPSLKRFDRTHHEDIVDQFSRLDRKLFEFNRARLMLLHWKGLPDLESGGELRILKREMNKKRRIMPIRRLLGEAGRAIQAIKPVFMMSPMSIATYVPPDSVVFDLVIFDEASQVKPVDAFGAIIRGHQTVVVGDSRQLPPTSFFDTVVDPDDDEEDFDNIGEMESILTLFKARGAAERMLRWHYRSRHHSLVAVSNMEFYDNRLLVFPSSGKNREARGLKLHHHPETAYERGTSRSNPDEALQVARAVMEHAGAHPDLTLGVVAFSTAQRDAIEAQLELLRRENPDCESFFTESGPEPFFVKNLENVQGDERDVIFVSIGYGKTKEGYLAMNFGPLNRDGGERRLNVLITRARLAMDVFSNFTADDLDLERSHARGVAALKTFLHYARTGKLETITHPPDGWNKVPESPFEEAVIEALRGRGIDVVPQVGTAGFFIDIGVRHPKQPGRYVLGIECDGATYHSSRSARDRDRLRQEVLEGLGWRLHRIWSTAWFQNPERELERALAAIESALQDDDDPPPGRRPGPERPVPSAITITRIAAGRPAGCGAFARYRRSRHRISLHGRELHELPTGELFEHLQEILKIEAPIHQMELSRRVVEAAGLQRTGKRIQTAVNRAVVSGIRRRKLARRGEFIWLASRDSVQVRDRSGLDAASRRLEMIPPEEIREAIQETVRRAFSLTPEEAVTDTARGLGISRVSSQMRHEIELHLEHLLDSGRLHLVRGRLSAIDGSATTVLQASA